LLLLCCFPFWSIWWMLGFPHFWAVFITFFNRGNQYSTSIQSTIQSQWNRNGM